MRGIAGMPFVLENDARSYPTSAADAPNRANDMVSG
jgi:hypothetical protein